jgi:hypothetical protein
VIKHELSRTQTQAIKRQAAKVCQRTKASIKRSYIVLTSGVVQFI